MPSSSSSSSSVLPLRSSPSPPPPPQPPQPPQRRRTPAQPAASASATPVAPPRWDGDGSVRVAIEIAAPLPFFDILIVPSPAMVALLQHSSAPHFSLRPDSSAHPPAMLRGTVSVKPQSAKDVDVLIARGDFTIRLFGRYEIDASKVRVSQEFDHQTVNVGNFGLNHGVFYLDEQTLWSQSVPATEYNPLSFHRRYPFAFPIPVDAPVSAQLDAGRIVWTLEATLNRHGRSWPKTATQVVHVRRVARFPIRQTVPPAPRLLDLGPLPHKKLVRGQTGGEEFAFEVQLPDPILIPPMEEDAGAAAGGGGSGGGVSGRARPKKEIERYRSTGRDDDELFEPEGVPVQVRLRSGRVPVGNVKSITAVLGQRAALNFFDQFQAPKRPEVANGTVGLWADHASPPIQIGVNRKARTLAPPPPPAPPTTHHRARTPSRHSSTTSRRRASSEWSAAEDHMDPSSPMGPDDANPGDITVYYTPPPSPVSSLDERDRESPTRTVSTRESGTTPSPPPHITSQRRTPSRQSTERSPAPARDASIYRRFRGLRRLVTRGHAITNAATYNLLSIPVNPEAGRLNGIGGNLIVSPPLPALPPIVPQAKPTSGGLGASAAVDLLDGSAASRRSSATTLVPVAERGGAQIGVRLREPSNAHVGGASAGRYIIEVGDGDGNGECYVGVEPRFVTGRQAAVAAAAAAAWLPLGGATFLHNVPSVRQQNLKVEHYVRIIIKYEAIAGAAAASSGDGSRAEPHDAPAAPAAMRKKTVAGKAPQALAAAISPTQKNAAQTLTVEFEVPTFLVHGIPPLRRQASATAAVAAAPRQ
ncbi:hypothetical protein DFJ73DRAFT_794623 [Zopfochytrium polystomum]|nr:hypothetical protein DFJ73DRAFT_794623 [Zopfochytrium polystomum]